MSDYTRDLEQVRAALVEERRRIIRTSIQTGEANKEGPSINIASDLQSLQSQIEAIDRAIDDEKNLEPNTLESTPLRV